MAENSYTKGQKVRVTASFVDFDENAIDPAVVELAYRDPSGNITTWTYNTDPELVRDSEGNYHADIVADESGRWYYYWSSEGTGQAAEEKSFYVEEPFAG